MRYVWQLHLTLRLKRNYLCNETIYRQTSPIYRILKFGELWLISGWDYVQHFDPIRHVRCFLLNLSTCLILTRIWMITWTKYGLINCKFCNQLECKADMTYRRCWNGRKLAKTDHFSQSEVVCSTNATRTDRQRFRRYLKFDVRKTVERLTARWLPERQMEEDDRKAVVSYSQTGRDLFRGTTSAWTAAEVGATAAVVMRRRRESGLTTGRSQPPTTTRVHCRWSHTVRPQFPKPETEMVFGRRRRPATAYWRTTSRQTNTAVCYND